VLIIMKTSLWPELLSAAVIGLSPMANDDRTGFVFELKSRFKISTSA
jgi:hypothetical protein